MRMDDVFADLEGAAEARERREMFSWASDSARAESARVSLDARLRANVGHHVELVVGSIIVSGQLLDVAESWCAIDKNAPKGAGNLKCSTLGEVVLTRPGVCIVPLTRIELARCDIRHHQSFAESAVGRSLSTVMRDFAAARLALTWSTRGGQLIRGLIQAVGKDHVVLLDDARAPAVLPFTSLEIAEVSFDRRDLPRDAARSMGSRTR